MDQRGDSRKAAETPHGRSPRLKRASAASGVPRQPGEIGVLGQNLRLEALQSRGQGGAAIPHLLRSNQAERRGLGKPLGVVEVFVPSPAAMDGLAQQVGQAKLDIAAAAICQMFRDQATEAQGLVKFAHQDQAAVGSDACALKINLERGVERDPITYWVLAPEAPRRRSCPDKR